MTTTLIGHARCSTNKQDLAAQKAALEKLGVAADRIYIDHGLTETNRSCPGLDQAVAAVRTGDTLIVPKLDRLARSVPDACTIADSERSDSFEIIYELKIAVSHQEARGHAVVAQGPGLHRLIWTPINQIL